MRALSGTRPERDGSQRSSLAGSVPTGFQRCRLRNASIRARGVAISAECALGAPRLFVRRELAVEVASPGEKANQLADGAAENPEVCVWLLWF